MVLADLAAALDLGAGELLGIGGVDVRDPGHVDERDALVRRAMPRPLDAREAVLAGPRRLGHQGPQLLLGHAAGALDVDVREREQRRQRLDRLPVRGRVVRDAGHRRDVRVAGCIHEHGRLDPALAALVPQPDRAQPPVVVEADARRPGVEQQLDARVLGQPLPEDLERLHVVRDAGARAVRVRTLERGAVCGQPPDDLPAEPADHPTGLLAGRVERVERVEDGGRGAAHEPEPVEQQRPRPEAGRRDRRRRAGRARTRRRRRRTGRSSVGSMPVQPGRVRDEDPRRRLLADPPPEPGHERGHQVAQPGPAVVGPEVAPRPEVQAKHEPVEVAGSPRPARSGRGRRCRGGTSSGRRCRTRA